MRHKNKIIKQTTTQLATQTVPEIRVIRSIDLEIEKSSTRKQSIRKKISNNNLAATITTSINQSNFLTRN